MTYDPNDPNHPDNIARAREAKRISDYEAGFYGAGGSDSDSYRAGKEAAEAIKRYTEPAKPAKQPDFSDASPADAIKGMSIIGALVVGGALAYSGISSWSESSKRDADRRAQQELLDRQTRHIASYETGERDPRFALTFAAYKRLEEDMHNELVRLFAKGEVCQAQQHALYASANQCNYSTESIYVNQAVPPEYKTIFSDVFDGAPAQRIQSGIVNANIWWHPYDAVPSYRAEFQISGNLEVIRPTLNEFLVTFNFPVGMLDKCLVHPPLPSGYVSPEDKERVYTLRERRDDRDFSCIRRGSTEIVLGYKQPGYDL